MKIEEHVTKVSVWYNFGRELFYFGDHELSAIVYKNMLEKIIEVEQTNGIKLHKGLALYNLGLSQLEMGNFDEGIPNILQAYSEDLKNFGSSTTQGLSAAKIREDNRYSWII